MEIYQKVKLRGMLNFVEDVRWAEVSKGVSICLGVVSLSVPIPIQLVYPFMNSCTIVAAVHAANRVDSQVESPWRSLMVALL